MANQQRKVPRKINKQREIEKKNRKKRKVKLVMLLIITILIAAGAYLFTSPSFNIQEISIKGNNQLSTQKVKQIAEINVGDNIFSKIGIVMKVKLKENGYIEDVQINKIYPNKVEIEIKEKNKAFQIQTESGKYIYIDEQGYILDCLTNKLEIPIIKGMDIKENEIQSQYRLGEDDLDKMENILQIREECKKIGIAEKITQIQVKNEYIISLENDGLTINLGDATNLKNRMYYVNAILKQEEGNRGTIYVNGNLNEGFSTYFSAE